LGATLCCDEWNDLAMFLFALVYSLNHCDQAHHLWCH